MNEGRVEHSMQNWTVCPRGHITVSGDGPCIRTGHYTPLRPHDRGRECGLPVININDVPAVHAAIRLHSVDDDDLSGHETVIAVMLKDLGVFK